MQLCYITDRAQLRGDLLGLIRQALLAGVDLIQIREKDLCAADLYALCGEVLRLPNHRGTKIIVNTRLDVALAAGANGVHLPSDTPPPRRFRALASTPFLIGVSCHSLAEAVRASAEGADYIAFGPVFETPSKKSYGPPQGVDKLREVCRAVMRPVLALGGINLHNARDCLAAGAAGVAGISLFQQSDGLQALVQALKKLDTSPSLRRASD